MSEMLEISLEQLAEQMRKLDTAWHERAASSYQHHEIAVTMVQLWKTQAEEMLRMLYGADQEQRGMISLNEARDIKGLP